MIRHFLVCLGFLAFVSGCGSHAANQISTIAQDHTPAVVRFSIEVGTQRSSWNTVNTAVQTIVGDTLRVKNNDTIAHRIHTDGIPFPHGLDIAPGASTDYVVTAPWDPATGQYLYDHNVGRTAKFWVKVAQTGAP